MSQGTDHNILVIRGTLTVELPKVHILYIQYTTGNELIGGGLLSLGATVLAMLTGDFFLSALTLTCYFTLKTLILNKTTSLSVCGPQ